MLTSSMVLKPKNLKYIWNSCGFCPDICALCTQVLQFLLAVMLILNIYRDQNNLQHFAYLTASYIWRGIVFFVHHQVKKLAQVPGYMDFQDSVYLQVLSGLNSGTLKAKKYK